MNANRSAGQLFLSLTILLVLAIAGVPKTSRAADWPQFLGPERNGISSETDLLDAWPENGPKEVWRVDGGVGMSGVAVSKGRAITLIQKEQQQWLVALDAKTGTTVWQTSVADAYKNGMGDGPRATPAISGESVFAFTGEGILACAKLSDGSIRWKRNTVKELNGKIADYGMACSPLVNGNHVIVTVGAPGSTVAAYDVNSGQLSWKVGNDRCGYSSPAIRQVAGTTQLVAYTGNSVLGIDPGAGKILWRFPYVTDYDCNIATPLAHRGRVFISSGENHGSAMLAIAPEEATPTEVWGSHGSKSVLRCEWQTPILIDGHLYGFDNVGSAGAVSHFTCVNAETGEQVWRKVRFGKGNLIAADGKLWICTMKGEFVVLEATTEGYRELGRKKMIGTTRQMPTLADGLIYLRDSEQILCLDVRK